MFSPRYWTNLFSWLLLTGVVGCGSFVSSIETWKELEAPASELKTSQIKAFEGDQWVARQDWTVWQGGQVLEGGFDPERVARWKHPAAKWIRDKLIRMKSSRTVATALPEEETSVRTSQELKVSDPEGSRLDWNLLLDQAGLSGWNGLILFARYEPEQAVEYFPLLIEMAEDSLPYEISKTSEFNEEKSVTNEKTSANFRAAAVEACGLLISGQASKETQPNLNRLIELGEKDDLPDEVRCELFRGLGRVLVPRDIPHLNETLKPISSYSVDNPAPKPEVRLAALDACLYHALRQGRLQSGEEIQKAWPPNLLNLRNDADQRFRIKIGQLIATTHHPMAWQLLKEQLMDAEIPVRQEALVSLGRLGTVEAREELRLQVKKPEDLTRVAAVKGLAYFGAEELRRSLVDTSPYVRQEVAAQLSQFQDQETARHLKQLLVDPNPQVQMEVIKGVVHWPDELAVGLLIHALQESSSLTRQNALSSLETRSGTPLIFPVHASREERLRESEQLARLWPKAIQIEFSTRNANSELPSQANQLRIADLKLDLKNLSEMDPLDPQAAQIQQRLMQLTSADVGWLEHHLTEAPPAQQAWILKEVLPKLAPSYACLQQMEQNDVQIRRRGAEHLAVEANKRPLGNLELWRLEQLLVREQDALVWRFAMLAIGQDATPQGARIAQMAVSHNWPDIRILGCQEFARHGSPEQALWLLPLFSDSNYLVQEAAVDAAMQCRNPIVIEGQPGMGQPGVRSLLGTNRSSLRVKVSACLAQFGDPQGIDELLRLSRDPDWNLRYQAISAMGASGQTRFVGTLAQLGWTEKHPSVQLALLQGLDLLVPETQRPAELRQKQSPESRLEVWVTWWNRQNPT